MLTFNGKFDWRKFAVNFVIGEKTNTNFIVFLVQDPHLPWTWFTIPQIGTNFSFAFLRHKNSVGTKAKLSLRQSLQRQERCRCVSSSFLPDKELMCGISLPGRSIVKFFHIQTTENQVQRTSQYCFLPDGQGGPSTSAPSSRTRV